MYISPTIALQYLENICTDKKKIPSVYDLSSSSFYFLIFYVSSF
jgi:hypothetical protein